MSRLSPNAMDALDCALGRRRRLRGVRILDGMARDSSRSNPGAAGASRTASSSGALRNLVGAGPSQVGTVGALRARDVSRPDDGHLRAALDKPAPVARVVRQDTSGGTPVSS